MMQSISSLMESILTQGISKQNIKPLHLRTTAQTPQTVRCLPSVFARLDHMCYVVGARAMLQHRRECSAYNCIDERGASFWGYCETQWVLNWGQEVGRCEQDERKERDFTLLHQARIRHQHARDWQKNNRAR